MSGGESAAIVVGMAVLLAVMARRRGKVVPAAEWDASWVWPVPTLIDAMGRRYEPTVSSGFGSPRRVGTEREHAHSGLDIMYKRRSRADRPDMPAGVKQPPDGFANGSAGYFAPPGTPIVAARAGKVWSVTDRPDGGGISVVIDHGKPWATYYTHLAAATVKPGMWVAMGQTIGSMGADRSEGAKLRHLHFEVWHGGHGPSASVDVWGDNVIQAWPSIDRNEV